MPNSLRKLAQRFSTSCAIFPCLLAIGVPSQAQKVATSQYDNARQGANLVETTLTPRNVDAQRFGKLFTLKVDGDIYAQPLFLAGVEIPGKGRHDVVYVATEHDSVYAFDAYSNPSTPLWQVSLAKDGEAPVPAGDTDCPFIEPEVGITSTPVIDPQTGTLYVLARTKTRPGVLTALAGQSQIAYSQRLHALAVTNGVEKLGGPVDIHAAMIGKGTGNHSGNLEFNPLRENPRASLLLANGLVYLTWGSSCDVGPYHGWVMAYDAHSLRQKAVFNASPDADDSGIWASDTGPAADKEGNLFVATGNGHFDVAGGGRDYGDSFLKLDGKTLHPADYFAPFNVDDLDADDKDLGSGGPLLLPDQPGPHPHLAVIAGKDGTVYLIDRDKMGHFQAKDDSQIVQSYPSSGGGIYASMAYWNHNLYAVSDSDRDAIRQFDVKDGRLSLKTSSGAGLKGMCSTPTVSANGMRDGVLWVLRSKVWNAGDSHAVLYAFDASNASHSLYSSEQNSSRDRAGLALRFNIPTIVNGHVYVGAKREVDVYGLLASNQAAK
jgi:hypothetical protein